MGTDISEKLINIFSYYEGRIDINDTDLLRKRERHRQARLVERNNTEKMFIERNGKQI